MINGYLFILIIGWDVDGWVFRLCEGFCFLFLRVLIFFVGLPSQYGRPQALQSLISLLILLAYLLALLDNCIIWCRWQKQYPCKINYTLISTSQDRMSGSVLFHTFSLVFQKLCCILFSGTCLLTCSEMGGRSLKSHCKNKENVGP